MRVKSILLYVVILLVVVSCDERRDAMKRLEEIDALTETKADSAAILLLQMEDEIAARKNEDVQAYYNLLTVKAKDKVFGKHSSDSLIMEVVRYYEEHQDMQHLPEAYYYVGRVNSDLMQSEKAILYFNMALLCDTTYVNNHLKARLYANLGYVYLRNRMYDDAISMQQCAHFYCEQEGDTLGMRYSAEDISTIERMMQVDTVDVVSVTLVRQKVQRLMEHAHAQSLRRQNAALEADGRAKRQMLLNGGIGVSVLLLVCLAFVLYMRKQRKHQLTEVTMNSVKDKAVPSKRRFYDSEVDDLLASLLKDNRVPSKENWDFIEEHVLRVFPSFRTQLYSHYDFSESEYHICLLIKVGVTPSNSARLMAMGNSSVTQSRLRMQQKVFGGHGSAKDWDAFVNSL